MSLWWLTKKKGNGWRGWGVLKIFMSSLLFGEFSFAPNRNLLLLYYLCITVSKSFPKRMMPPWGGWDEAGKGSRSFLRTIKIIECQGHLCIDDTGVGSIICPIIIMQCSCDKIGGLDAGFSPWISVFNIDRPAKKIILSPDLSSLAFSSTNLSSHWRWTRIPGPFAVA